MGNNDVDYSSWENQGFTGWYPPFPVTPQDESDYHTWAQQTGGWRKLEGALLGGSGMTDDNSRAHASGRVDPNTLMATGGAIRNSMEALTYVSKFILDQSAAIAGEKKAWSGPAAEAFLAKMKTFAALIDAQVSQLSGGDSSDGSNSIPNQLFNAAQALAWAQSSAIYLDGAWADYASQMGASTGNTGAINITGSSVEPQFRHALESVVDKVATYSSIKVPPLSTVNDITPPPPAPPPPPGDPNGPGGGDDNSAQDWFDKAQAELDQEKADLQKEADDLAANQKKAQDDLDKKLKDAQDNLQKNLNNLPPPPDPSKLPPPPTFDPNAANPNGAPPPPPVFDPNSVPPPGDPNASAPPPPPAFDPNTGKTDVSDPPPPPVFDPNSVPPPGDPNASAPPPPPAFDPSSIPPPVTPNLGNPGGGLPGLGGAPKAPVGGAPKGSDTGIGDPPKTPAFDPTGVPKGVDAPKGLTEPNGLGDPNGLSNPNGVASPNGIGSPGNAGSPMMPPGGGAAGGMPSLPDAPDASGLIDGSSEPFEPTGVDEFEPTASQRGASAGGSGLDFDEPGAGRAGLPPSGMPPEGGGGGSPGNVSLPDAPDSSGLIDGSNEPWQTADAIEPDLTEVAGGAAAGGGGLSGTGEGGPMMPPPGGGGGGGLGQAQLPDRPDSSALVTGDGTEWEQEEAAELSAGVLPGGQGLTTPPGPEKSGGEKPGDEKHRKREAAVIVPIPLPQTGSENPEAIGTPGAAPAPALAVPIGAVAAPGTEEPEDREAPARPDAAELLQETATAWSPEPARAPEQDDRVPVVVAAQAATADASSWDNFGGAGWLLDDEPSDEERTDGDQQ
jgi:collagen type III alpha